jgi:HK97 family phage major capsid protein
MAVYNSLQARADVASYLPTTYTRSLITEILPQQSAAMKLFRNIRMSSKELTYPVLSAFPLAYWVNGDTGLKQTTEMAWQDKTITAEELAVIVPIPDVVLSDARDSGFDIMAEMKPYIAEAMARALDAAIFFGTNAPDSFPDDVVTAATAAGNTFERGTTAANAGGIAEDINQLMALVEADGFMPSGFVAPRGYLARLRSARDTTGQALADVSAGQLYGLPVAYTLHGQWPSGAEAAELFVGDWADKFVLGIREDIKVTVTNTGVIQDGAGAIVYNLFQQDMTALRVTFRAGWQVANPITHEEETEADRYPAAVMLSPGA